MTYSSPGAASGYTNDQSWHDEFRFLKLVADPQVRQMIDEAARTSSKVRTVDNFLATVVHGEKPTLRLTDFHGTYLSAALGIKTKTARQASFAAPVGLTLAAALSALAAKGFPPVRVVQAADGCAFEAILHANLITWAGGITLGVAGNGQGSVVSIATTVSGQVYDWGRGKRTIAALLADITARLTA